MLVSLSSATKTSGISPGTTSGRSHSGGKPVAGDTLTVAHPGQEKAIIHTSQVGPYRVEVTSSKCLWCDKSALGPRTAPQLGTRLPLEDLDDIFAGEESRSFTPVFPCWRKAIERHGHHIKANSRWSDDSLRLEYQSNSAWIM